MRVQTYAPLRLQLYFDGHSWLAQQLTQAGTACEVAANAFLAIVDP